MQIKHTVQIDDGLFELSRFLDGESFGPTAVVPQGEEGPFNTLLVRDTEQQQTLSVSTFAWLGHDLGRKLKNPQATAQIMAALHFGMEQGLATPYPDLD